MTLVEAGRSFGLEMVPLAVDSASLVDVALPALVEFPDRFVVLVSQRRGARRWVVYEPDGGTKRLSGKAVASRSTGALISIAPGPRFLADLNGDSRPGGWRTLARQAATTPALWPVLGAVFALSILMLAIGLASPLFTKLLVDEVLPLRAEGVLPVAAVGLALLVVTTYLGTLLRGRLLVLLSARLDNRLMTSLFSHLMAQPYRFFAERSTGDLVQRFSSNAVIRNALTQQTVSGLLCTIQVVVFGAILTWVSPVFGLVGIGLGAVEVAVLIVPSRRIRSLTEAELSEVAATQSLTVEVVGGAAYLKASGVEGGMLTSWAARLHDQLAASMRRQSFMSFVQCTSATVSGSSALILLLVGGAQVLDGAMTLGTALALITLSANFLTPLAQLISAMQSLQAVQGHVDRLAAVLEAPVERAGDVKPPMDPIAGSIEFREVSFRYHEDDRWALRGMSFRVDPGQRVALVGTSGSGKTSVSNMLLGLYEPQHGAVLVDGVDLRERDLGSFRRQCGVVLQNPVVYEGTIRENVAFHDESVTDEQVESALWVACLTDDVARMPIGVHTTVGEQGKRLSGGQRQRLAIARAFVRAPRMLVLDEATGALDSVTEARVTANIRAAAVTTFVIAHRLSTIVDADLVLVLDDGVIVESGNHHDLVTRGGPYARLVTADHTASSNISP